jgi:hypothetical protein
MKLSFNFLRKLSKEKQLVTFLQYIYKDAKEKMSYKPNMEVALHNHP